MNTVKIGENQRDSMAADDALDDALEIIQRVTEEILRARRRAGGGMHSSLAGNLSEHAAPADFVGQIAETVIRKVGSTQEQQVQSRFASDVAAAVEDLRRQGKAAGTLSRRITVRVDPGILEAAAERFGTTTPSDTVNASLAAAAAPNRFKQWLRETQDTLPDDFELAI
ncbi:MAG TPA: hypothetical protein VGD08_22185 [Stellaceae bacterium]